MPLIPGKQIDTGARGVATANLVDGLLSADAAGRAKFATDFFDSATVTAKFESASIALDRLAEAVLQADGGQPFTADMPAGGFKITGLADGVDATDAATKAQVDAAQAGLDLKESVRLATDAVLPDVTPSGTGVGKTLTADANGVLTVDSVATVLNDRILVKDQADGVDNGIYDVTTEGTASVPFVLTRSTDADTDAEVTSGMFTFAEEGTINADSGFALTTNNPIVVDTTVLVFTQISGLGQITAGTGMTKTGNTLNVIGGNGITANADDIETDYGTPPSLAVGDSAAAGVANTAIRTDGTFGIAAATPVSLAAANDAGSSGDFVHSDHAHARDVERQEPVTTETITGTDTALADTLDATPVNNASVSLFLNGVRQKQGATFDYTISGSTITWLADTGTAVDMDTTDELDAKYISQG